MPIELPPDIPTPVDDVFYDDTPSYNRVIEENGDRYYVEYPIKNNCHIVVCETVCYCKTKVRKKDATR